MTVEELISGKKKIKVEVPGYGQWSNEGPFSEEIYPFSLKINDYAYLYDSSGFDNTDTWRTIKITYIRGEIVFFIFTDNTEKEHHFNKNAVLVHCGNIKPTKFIVDTEEWPTKYFEFVCDCPYTKIIYK